MVDSFDKDAPFFIVGSPRSGTTLLERILNRHSRIFIPPETEFFFLLENFSGISSENKSEKELKKLVDYYLNQYAARFLELPSNSVDILLTKETRSYLDVFYNLMNYLSESAKKPRWGEKTPHHIRCAKKIHDCMPKAKFINLIRDGRAVIKSRFRHPLWNDNLYSAAKTWKCDVRLSGELQKLLNDDQYHLVSYEQLVQDPKRTIEKILNFLNEDIEEGLLAPPSEDQKTYSRYYSQPWMIKSTSRVESESISSWRNEYLPEELCLIEKLIGRELIENHYSLTKVKSLGWITLLAKDYFSFQIGRLRRFSRRMTQEMPKKD